MRMHWNIPSLLLPLLFVPTTITTAFFSPISKRHYQTKYSTALNSNMDASSLLVVGLNAALQKRFILPSNTDLIPGDVHRATSIQQGVGGKGQDVLITLSCLQSKTSDTKKKISIAQFIGQGPEGDNVLSLLRQHSFDDSFTIRTESGIRTCTTIVATEYSTELVEPSGVIEPEELSDLLTKVEQSDVNAMCIMGSMPPGCPADTYANILKNMISSSSDEEDDKSYYCLIDSVIGLDELLQELNDGRSKLKNKLNAVLKINISELSKLGGASDAITSDELTEQEKVSKVVTSFLSTFSNAQSALDYIAITAGKDPAYLVQLDSDKESTDVIQCLYKLAIPNLTQSHPDQTLYPIGAGDSVASGTLAAWLELVTSSESSNSILDSDIQSTILSAKKSYGDNVDDFACAFAFGLACGSASCLQEQNSVLDQEDVKKIFTDMPAPAAL